LPLPIVFSRKYFPILICRFDNNPVRTQLFEVIVDVRERAVGDAGESGMDNSGGIEE
jgi:hypothetical protein